MTAETVHAVSQAGLSKIFEYSLESADLQSGCRMLHPTPKSPRLCPSHRFMGSVHLLCLQQGTMPCLWHLHFPVPLFMMLGNKAGWLERSGGQENIDPGEGLVPSAPIVTSIAKCLSLTEGLWVLFTLPTPCVSPQSPWV